MMCFVLFPIKNRYSIIEATIRTYIGVLVRIFFIGNCVAIIYIFRLHTKYKGYLDSADDERSSLIEEILLIGPLLLIESISEKLVTNYIRMYYIGYTQSVFVSLQDRTNLL